MQMFLIFLEVPAGRTEQGSGLQFAHSYGQTAARCTIDTIEQEFFSIDPVYVDNFWYNFISLKKDKISSMTTFSNTFIGLKKSKKRKKKRKETKQK